jgi:ATP-dependent helicase/nuclease subunit B
MDAIAPDHHALRLWQDRMGELAGRMAAAGAHAARTVVLVPYIQVVPVARQAWARRVPDGFAPRFETTMNWARGTGFEPGAGDVSMDMARDLPAARHWLEQAGLTARAESLASRLVETAWQLAPLAAAVRPGERTQWAAHARACVSRGMEAPVLQVEAAVARIAVEWAAASAYATDALFAQTEALDLLVAMPGLHPDPLQDALLTAAGARGLALPLAEPGPAGALALHEAADAADEAERAAACVMRHLEAGRVPLALAATDRVLTRRVGALLASHGVPLRDETGWKLSTTRSAAGLMAALRACAWDATSDEVLDWIKNAPALPAGIASAVERRLRKAAVRQWRALGPGDWAGSEAVAARVADVQQWRESMQGSHTLAAWLASLRAVLQSSGQWADLARDAAGQQLIEVLRLDEARAAEFDEALQAGRRLSLQEFTSWVNEVLEAGSFKPEPDPAAPVVVLPLSQLLGRPFAALVLAGCDERSLPAAPDPAGAWTPSQREGLGLPSREALAALQRAAWDEALRTPHCDVLWRRSDEGGEPVLPSPLVQSLRLRMAGTPTAPDPRDGRELSRAPVQRPRALGALLPVDTLSASSYEDLRRCPYRFFALRQLGLREADEIEAEVDKRDFGTWLHSVLRAFHEALRTDPQPPDASRARLLDDCAREALRELRLEEGEFLPFEAGWPAMRDGYLAWLARHEASGARFEGAEAEHRVALGSLALMGRIDRMDRLADGAPLVMDYKTEHIQVTRDRMKRPLEDTQLAFYAALVGGDDLRAAYLNVGERGEVRDVPHEGVLQARDLLLEAIDSDMRRIAAGEMMPALGEGRVCELCAARGLCRRDFWDE